MLTEGSATIAERDYVIHKRLGAHFSGIAEEFNRVLHENSLLRERIRELEAALGQAGGGAGGSGNGRSRSASNPAMAEDEFGGNASRRSRVSFKNPTRRLAGASKSKAVPCTVVSRLSLPDGAWEVGADVGRRGGSAYFVLMCAGE